MHRVWALNHIKKLIMRLSMVNSKISLGKCHTALENMWVIFKYILILIYNNYIVIGE